MTCPDCGKTMRQIGNTNLSLAHNTKMFSWYVCAAIVHRSGIDTTCGVSAAS